MVVGTTADDAETTLHKLFGKHLGILLYLLGPLFELGLQSLTEGYGLGSDDMLQWTTLLSREDCGVQQLRHLLDNALRGLVAPRIVEVLA